MKSAHSSKLGANLGTMKDSECAGVTIPKSTAPAIAKTIHFPRLTKTLKHELDLELAYVCYEDAHPFTLYET